MRTVTVTWDTAEGRFVAEGTHRGRSIRINAPPEPNSGRGPTGFSATELLLAGAGACAAWDVVQILRKRRSRLAALEVVVEADQQPDPPWTYQRIALHFRVACERTTPAVMARIVRLSVVRYCSVINTVAGVAAIEATIELVTADGQTSGRRPIELSIPSRPSPDAATGARSLGVTEPARDED